MQSEMLRYGAQQLASQPTLCASWRMATELPSQLVMWNKETLVARLAEAKDLAQVLHFELGYSVEQLSGYTICWKASSAKS